jgi:hypothetical protein
MTPCQFACALAAVSAIRSDSVSQGLSLFVYGKMSRYASTAGHKEGPILAEIILLRLEAAIRASCDTLPFTHSRFVPICLGMPFKRSRKRR